MESTELTSKALNPKQLSVLNNLLALGGDRPVMRESLVSELKEKLLDGTSESVISWSEKSLYMTKSQVQASLSCETKFKNQSQVLSTGLNASAAVGIISHKAIQLFYTHPNRNLSEHVRTAMDAARSDEKFNDWFNECGIGVQSDVMMQATSKVANFIDDWPALQERWNPRFEESLSAKIGRLTLSARTDLIIGRPRSDLKQTIFICDLKSGNLHDDHEDEAMFYALVATLRHEVAPWRSLVYSLSSGDYTEPDVTEEKLFKAADRVISAVKSTVDVLMEKREPLLTPGDHCSYCPLVKTCPVGTLKLGLN